MGHNPSPPFILGENLTPVCKLALFYYTFLCWFFLLFQMLDNSIRVALSITCHVKGLDLAAQDFISDNLYQESDIPRFSSIPGGKKGAVQALSNDQCGEFLSLLSVVGAEAAVKGGIPVNHFSGLLLSLDFSPCSPGTQKPESS